MNKPKPSRFNIYRYQILPINRAQLKLFGEVKNLDDLISKKNEFFARALQDMDSIPAARTEVKHTILAQSEDRFFMKVGKKRKQIEDHDDLITREERETWPSVAVLINNKPDKQLIGIQIDAKVYHQTSTLANSLESALNEQLKEYYLATYVEPITDKSEFWKIIDRYKGLIQNVEFELITPNMANVSKALSDDLRELGKMTNSHKMKVALAANKAESLDIRADNEQVSGLVDYTSQGGGKASIKVEGLRKFTTQRGRRVVEVDSIDVTGVSQEEASSVLSEIINKFD